MLQFNKVSLGIVILKWVVVVGKFFARLTQLTSIFLLLVPAFVSEEVRDPCQTANGREILRYRSMIPN